MHVRVAGMAVVSMAVRPVRGMGVRLRRVGGGVPKGDKRSGHLLSDSQMHARCLAQHCSGGDEPAAGAKSETSHSQYDYFPKAGTGSSVAGCSSLAFSAARMRLGVAGRVYMRTPSAS